MMTASPVSLLLSALCQMNMDASYPSLLPLCQYNSINPGQQRREVFQKILAGRFKMDPHRSITFQSFQIVKAGYPYLEERPGKIGEILDITPFAKGLNMMLLNGIGKEQFFYQRAVETVLNVPCFNDFHNYTAIRAMCPTASLNTETSSSVVKYEGLTRTDPSGNVPIY